MEKTQGSAVVVGLSAASLPMLLFQFFNMGQVTVGIVLAVGLVFGGFVQLIAGIQTDKLNDSFSTALFTSGASFWISMSILWFMEMQKWLRLTPCDMGAFFICWSIYSVLLLAIAIRINTAYALMQTFHTLGLISLALVQYGYPSMITASVLAFVCASCISFYIVFALLYNSVHEDKEVSLGEPWRY